MSYNIFHSRDLLLICPLKTVQDAILTHRAFKICALFNFYFQIVLGSILRTRTPPLVARGYVVGRPGSTIAKKTRRPPLIRRRRPTSLLSRVSQCTVVQGCSKNYFKNLRSIHFWELQVYQWMGTWYILAK